VGDAGEAEVIGFNKGGTVDTRGLSVTMVQAQHSAGDWVAGGGTGGSVYLGEPAGFVLEIEDGRRVYFAGDTDLFGDMALIRDLHRPEVAFLPIGGHYTMGPRGAAKAAQLLGVKAVVPIHYGTFPVLVGTPDELRRELESLGAAIEVVAPERGEETPVP
jgi:L-ascorbate metabolism protein UlaG (beta-lactamase superfamily)